MKVQLTISKNMFLIETFSTTVKKFIILAEHKTLEAAQADLKMWEAA